MSVEVRLNKKYAVKTLDLAVSDIDEGSRMVKFYASAFDIKDSDGDIIKKGAFKKSIQERGADSVGRKIAHLRNHDWEHQIGNIQEISEDAKGLFVVSKLGTSTKGEDALRDYQDEILREHSIGFNYVKDKIKKIDETTFEIFEVKLWEVSGVTFGANEFTPVIDVAKGLEGFDNVAEKLNNMCLSFEKALRHGKGTDERLEGLEFRFKQIQQLIDSLKEVKPSVKDTLRTEEPNENLHAKELAQKMFYLNLLKK
jgi:HK97 family phage prohead protease